jgi:purine-binding chemotaxis protein CheW
MNANAKLDQPGGGARADAAGDSSRWVTFRLQNEKYGINVMSVREVLKVTEIAPVPGAPDFVLGIINLRGNVVTVVDTHYRFGLPPQKMDDATRIVIVEHQDQVVGIMVDSVAEVLNIAAGAIEVAPNVGNDESAKFIQGVSQQGDELVILIDHQKLLAE